MKCVHCQREIADGSNFCPYCGNTQSLPGSSSAPTTPPPSQAPPAWQTPQPQAGAPFTPPVGPQPVAPPPGGSPSQRATLAMTLGIASLIGGVMGCCGPYCLMLPPLIGGGIGIAAFVMGRNELEDIAAGFSPRAGESQANTGKVTGMIGAAISAITFLGWIVLLLFALIGDASGY